MSDALTIGDFSLMTHLSIKTLRHYHQVGLLESAEVDPGTGYRYYRVEQIPTAQIIQRFRDLNMPVIEVKAVLAVPDLDTRNALIAAHLSRLEGELEQTRKVVMSLRNLLEPPIAPISVEHRTILATRAVGIHEVVDLSDLLFWYHGALGELYATVAVQGLQPSGPCRARATSLLSGFASKRYVTLNVGCTTTFCKEERKALLFLSFFFARLLRLSRLIGEDHGPGPGRF